MIMAIRRKRGDVGKLCYLVVCLLAFQLSFFVASCQDVSNRQRCFDRALAKFDSSEDSRRVLSAFRDTMRSWNLAKIRTVMYYSNSLVKIDAVLLDTARRRSVVVILSIDTVKGAKLDFVNIYAGEERGGSVYFYSAGLPTIAIDKPRARVDMDEEFRRVADAWRANAADGKYFDCDNLSIREAFFDELFKYDLHSLHKYFWSDRE